MEVGNDGGITIGVGGAVLKIGAGFAAAALSACLGIFGVKKYQKRKPRTGTRK